MVTSSAALGRRSRTLAWSLVALLVLVSVVDAFTPRDLPLFTFMLVPVVGSAMLGRPLFTVGLTLLALVLVVPLAVLQEYEARYVVTRMVLIGLSGLVAALLAGVVARRSAAERQAAAHMRESEARYRLLAEHSRDVIVQADEVGRLVFVSPSVRELLGYEPAELVGTSMQAILHPDDSSLVDVVKTGMADGGLDETSEARLRRKDGTYVWVGRTGRPLVDDSGRLVGVVASWRGIGEQVRARSDLQTRARHDELTGALNRREMLAVLERLRHSGREPGDLVAVLFIDVDDFKATNDDHGHAAGDEFLRVLRHRIADAIRDSDAVARLGGDEFAVALSGLHSLDEAASIAEKIRASVALPVATPAGVVSNTVSIGVATFSPEATVADVLKRADVAMYRAKREGRDRVVVVSEDPERVLP